MSSLSGDIVKAGWLHRQSTVLKKWKRHWFAITRDGILRYFEYEQASSAEDAVRMKVDCLSILTGNDIVDVSPPEGCGRSCMITLKFRNKIWNLCAESPDDMHAWKLALEDCRVVSDYPQQNTLPYGSGPYPQQQTVYIHPSQQMFYGPHPPPYVVQQGTTYYGQPGNTTVVVQDDPYYHRGRYNGADVGMGVVAGAAVGSMMWGPLLWW